MKYVIANWKMNLGIRESVALARGTLRALQGKEKVPEVVICPSFTALAEVKKTLSRTRMYLGAQNAGPARAGAFTGEVGVSQLEDVGCTYVILGHSERRELLGEENKVINAKLKAIYESSGITPVLCVGESKKIRDAGEAEMFIKKELQNVLSDVVVGKRKRLLIAYEPLWAIGSGKSAAVPDAIAMLELIRTTVKKSLGISDEQLSVLYGGSVTSENAHAFLREPSVDGLLIGGASLKIHDIHAIIESACDVVTAQDTVWH